MIRTLLVLLLPTLAVAAEPVRLTGTTMGPIVWNVSVDALPFGMEATALKQRIDARLERVNALMSTWREGSDVSRFNRHTGDDWFVVRGKTAVVVARAIEISRETDGAFDVTVAPLVNLWSFGEQDVPDRIPTDAEIEAARADVGWRLVEVDPNFQALRKTRPGVTLNLSAIAKGFAVDEVARELEGLNIEGFLVEVGGELRVRGRKPDDTDWRVGIETPNDGLARRVHRALVIGDRSLATSGDYRSYFEVDGRRYSHTIDPSTGRPITHRLASVSVVADDCTTADAWATALMVLGPDEGYDLAERRGIAAYFLVRAPEGAAEPFVARATTPFRSIVGPDTGPIHEPDHGSPVTTYLIAFGVFLTAIAAMAVGVIFGRRRIEGSCGGLANIKDREGNSVCDACTNPLPTCGGVQEGRERDTEPSESVTG